MGETRSPAELLAATIMARWKGGVTTNIDVSRLVAEYLKLADEIRSSMLDRASQK